MVKRLYVHNYRCLENFDLKLGETPSALIVGRNGAGKSTVRAVLQLLQRVGRGVNRVKGLVAPEDFSYGRTETPMRIEIEAELKGRAYRYVLVFDFPPGFREVRVSQEHLTINGEPAYTREEANVSFSGAAGRDEDRFRLDWHLIALPIIQDRSLQDPLSVFRTWLAQSLILSPVPSHIKADSDEGSLEPSLELTDLAEWFRELTTQYPASYADIEAHLKDVMPDLSVIRNKATGSEARQLVFEFQQGERTLTLPLDASPMERSALSPVRSSSRPTRPMDRCYASGMSRTTMSDCPRSIGSCSLCERHSDREASSSRPRITPRQSARSLTRRRSCSFARATWSRQCLASPPI